MGFRNKAPISFKYIKTKISALLKISYSYCQNDYIDVGI